jgi:hypothetical protein
MVVCHLEITILLPLGQIKMYKPVFSCGLPQAFSRGLSAATKVYNGGQRINFYLYSEGEFF